MRVELPPARPSSLGWASVQVGDAAGLGLEGPVGVLWPLAKSLENLSHQRTLPGGGWSGQLPALVSLEPGNSPKRQQGGRGSLHPVGPRKLASQGAARCGAGSCDPDASPLVHVGWGHTCGDACLGCINSSKHLLPGLLIRPCLSLQLPVLPGQDSACLVEHLYCKGAFLLQCGLGALSTCCKSSSRSLLYSVTCG